MCSQSFRAPNLFQTQGDAPPAESRTDASPPSIVGTLHCRDHPHHAVIHGNSNPRRSRLAATYRLCGAREGSQRHQIALMPAGNSQHQERGCAKLVRANVRRRIKLFAIFAQRVNISPIFYTFAI